MKKIHGIFIIVITLFLRSIQSVLTQIVAYIDEQTGTSFVDVNNYFLFEHNVILVILLLKSKEW